MTTSHFDNDKSNDKDKRPTNNPSGDTPAPAPFTDDAIELPPKTRGYRNVAHRETFDYQPTSTAQLPEPEPWIEMMVNGVLESIHGVRDARQFIRWMSQDVFNAIEARATSVRRRHQTLKKPIARPAFTLGNIIIAYPRDGVVEASAVVHGPTRVRAVAMRMEGLDQRWMTTSFRML